MESLKTHQDGTPETLTLMGTMHSDRIFFRNWPRQYGIDNTPGAIDVEEGTLNMAVFFLFVQHEHALMGVSS